ncbi:hypothetical protein CDO73_01395 [Saccharibacillus sp. O23]|uniref:hypothetical protein n=1 Tax=Saccharibacillus sp. O23 TaxID=2009338 RepID=UPI000B4E3CE8|nr:hypothetical protein [Saccharibacillus sp. O23]OWR33188.1 hypothetical protein CDO73_01395 [Saccharibacillus sp. O23]
MNSCDLLLLREKVQGIGEDDAALCAGLNNQMFTGLYAGKPLYMLQGRKVLFIDELLEGLEADFDKLDPEDLLDLPPDRRDRVLIVLPYVDFDKIAGLKANTVHFMSVYTTYALEDIDRGELVLRGLHENEYIRKRLKVSDFFHLSSLKIKPLMVNYRILHIRSERVSEDAIRACIRRRIGELRADEQYFVEGEGWVKGRSFYGEVSRKLTEEWNESFNRVAKFVFFQSMLNGSSFFYRREFAAALTGRGESPEAAEGLYRAGNLWRKLGRYLQRLMMENKPLDESVARELMIEIERTETAAIAALEQETGGLAPLHSSGRT